MKAGQGIKDRVSLCPELENLKSGPVADRTVPARSRPLRSSWAHGACCYFIGLGVSKEQQLAPAASPGVRLSRRSRGPVLESRQLCAETDGCIEQRRVRISRLPKKGFPLRRVSSGRDRQSQPSPRLHDRKERQRGHGRDDGRSEGAVRDTVQRDLAGSAHPQRFQIHAEDESSKAGGRATFTLAHREQ